ncbi:hypothetical protein ACFQ1T_04950 [Methylophilus glucosoxydans]|uniref:Integrase catalytic domain-containing protein n=1 Tax=Methylophilus glucosoxydans TaxID=752553 RepID=A0ABW3GER7_9PROT
MKNKHNIFPGMAISPVNQSSKLIKGLMRILMLNLESGTVICIQATPQQRHNRNYYLQPIIITVAAINDEIDQNNIALHHLGIKSRADVLLSDEELDRKYGSSPCPAVVARRERLVILNALVPEGMDYSVLLDPQLRNEIVANYLTKHGKTQNQKQAKAAVVQLIYQFFAEGSTPNALTPYFSQRGGRGKEKKQTKKSGARNSPTKNGIKGVEGFVMTQRDKEICGYCMKHYAHGKNSINKALSDMWRHFYSTPVQSPNGQVTPELYPKFLRPTKSQFERWGQKYSGLNLMTRHLNSQQLARFDRALLGTAQDGIVAVGQVASIDSTSTDVHFVSMLNRQTRIGLMNRILVVDSLYGYIAGFYMGTEASSTETVKLAILHAGSEKSDWLKWLGLEDEIPSEDWLGLKFDTFNADNTEARTMEIIDSITALNGGMRYVPVARSDLNSIVETAHHSLHRSVDHKEPGTTRGKKTDRGDIKPELEARITIIEGIRDIARAIHVHNTKSLTHITPSLNMRQEILDKGLKLSRLNLTRLAMRQGRFNSNGIHFDDFVIKFSMPIKGTFTAKGVKLHNPKANRREFIGSLRFVSNDPIMVEKFTRAKTARKGSPENFDATFFHNPYCLDKIFYLDVQTGKTYTLYQVAWEEDFKEYTLDDHMDMQNQDAVRHHFEDEDNEQLVTVLDHRIEVTGNNAKKAYQADIAVNPPLSKSQIAKGRNENRQKERPLLKHGIVIPVEALADVAPETMPLPEVVANQPPLINQTPPVLNPSQRLDRDFSSRKMRNLLNAIIAEDD